jgi:hypothetical protein
MLGKCKFFSGLCCAVSEFLPPPEENSNSLLSACRDLLFHCVLLWVMHLCNYFHVSTLASSGGIHLEMMELSCYINTDHRTRSCQHKNCGLYRNLEHGMLRATGRKFLLKTASGLYTVISLWRAQYGWTAYICVPYVCRREQPLPGQVLRPKGVQEFPAELLSSRNTFLNSKYFTLWCCFVLNQRGNQICDTNEFSHNGHSPIRMTDQADSLSVCCECGPDPVWWIFNLSCSFFI